MRIIIMKNKALWQKILVFLLVLLICVLVFLSPARYIAAIGLEPILVRQNIKNPYVDSNYAGWKQVHFKECRGFFLPAEWSMLETDGVYTIIDASEEVWAHGASLGTATDRFQSYKAFISEVYETEPINISFDSFTPFMMMDGSDIDKLTVHSEDREETYYCIQLFVSTESEFVILLSEDLEAEEDQFQLAEALVYSYAFHVDK